MDVILIIQLSVFFTDFVLLERDRIKSIKKMTSLLRNAGYDVDNANMDKLYMDLKNNYGYYHKDESSYCDFLYLSIFPITNLMVLHSILFDKKYKEFNDNLVSFMNEDHLKENDIYKKKVEENKNSFNIQSKNISSTNNCYSQNKEKKKVRVLKK